MGRPNPEDQHFLMTRHLQAVLGARPLEIYDPRCGHHWDDTQQHSRLTKQSLGLPLWFHFFFSLTRLMHVFRAFLTL